MYVARVGVTLGLSAVIASMTFTGCVRSRTTAWNEDTGAVERVQVKEGGNVRSVLQNRLTQVTVTGEGEWKNSNRSMAREMALAQAINDLAKKAGAVLVEQDATIFNDEAMNKMRLRAANVVYGYSISSEKWEPETTTYKVAIEQNAWRIVERLEEYHPFPWLTGVAR